MADFRPQTGRIILAAAQSIIQQSQANRELQLRQEQLELQRQETANLLELKNQQLEAKQGFLEVQQKQLELKTAALGSDTEQKAADLQKTKAESRLKEIEAFDKLAGSVTGNRQSLPFRAREMSSSTARQFDLDKAFESAPPDASGLNPLIEFKGQTQTNLVAQRAQIRAQKTKLLGELVTPEQQAKNQVEADKMETQIKNLTRGIEIAARMSTEDPSAEGKAFAQKVFGLSPEAYDLMTSNAVSVDSARSFLFSGTPDPVVEAAVTEVVGGNYEPILRLAGGRIYTNDPGKPVNEQGLRQLLQYLIGRGAPRETLADLFAEVTRGR